MALESVKPLVRDLHQKESAEKTEPSTHKFRGFAQHWQRSSETISAKVTFIDEVKAHDNHFVESSSHRFV
jgi:hypothetical protein